MADSDGEYVQDGRSSSDEADLSMTGIGINSASGYNTRPQSKSAGLQATRNSLEKAKGKGKRKATGQARWEASAQSLGLQEGADGRIASVLEWDLEAAKRARLKKDTTPLQRGIIRHLILVLDLSEAMSDKDFKPNRYTLTLRYTLSYISEFFEQNPISQLAIVGMKDGLAKPISELGGNPNLHMTAVRALMQREGQGNPSLQNALDMSCALLQGAPSHGTREVVIVLGALFTSDPGDIYGTIRRCAKERLRVGIVGMGARMHICGEIVGRTNGGDDSGYGIATDETSLRDLLMATTTPPEIRGESVQGPTAQASLLKMGFPSRIAEEVPSLCACHNELSMGGYQCPQCMIKVCTLPTECPVCGLTLILSTHLARSYHHLFPLRRWVEVSWERARELGTVECRSCLTEFPKEPSQEEVDNDGDTTMAGASGSSAKGASNTGQSQHQRGNKDGVSESSRYECETCQNHFCIDCDVFCHETLHNCPGCQSQAHLPGLQTEETATEEQNREEEGPKET